MQRMYYEVFLDTNIYDGVNYSFRNALFTAFRNRVAARLSFRLQIRKNGQRKVFL